MKKKCGKNLFLGLIAGMFWKQLPSLLFSSSPRPCQSRGSHVNQLLIIYIAWRPFVKSLEYQLQLQLAVFPLYQRHDQPLGASRHMLLPCERSGNKCEATNGGPSTSPSSPPPTPPPPPDVRESIAAGECNSELNECCIGWNFYFNSIHSLGILKLILM